MTSPEIRFQNPIYSPIPIPNPNLKFAREDETNRKIVIRKGARRVAHAGSTAIAGVATADAVAIDIAPEKVMVKVGPEILLTPGF